ncbi:glutathionylspermidine synthase family protein [Schnuerera sp. xch1]|uniref:glutathionylspermidine synthase family protein n=1 Tax=Schnuerera sp. xch1 TaxID=2874283 RepID=UPI001CBD3C0E|nr:glutathionylspermidine synthase family protein [Schnuerera sp. xch1]MBZ2174766.1 glutathionylspermidine synthase family protein [Schnuerera sp. xch1]
MKSTEINNEYIKLVVQDAEIYLKDYKVTLEKAANSNAIYKGKPVPFLYHPMFFTEEDVDNFRKIGDMMISIANKVINRYIEDGSFRKKFGFSNLLEELILLDNGYDINVPIGRFDVFYKDYEDFKFCELNTDGSSAMNEDNTLGRILLETKAMKQFRQKYKLSLFELFDKWVKDSIDIYRKYDSSNSKPNVAIIDFTESGTSKEFEEFKSAYIRSGYNCIIADPRDLSYRDGKLYFDDYRIDLVYRRMVTFELIERAEEIQDFIQAYKNEAMCTIGSIRSQVVHNKIIFKVLHDEDTLKFLSQEEREFIKKHVPYTELFKGDKGVFNEVLNNKDKYIMKPLDLNGSRGVFVGRDFSKDEWRKRLKEVWDKDYIYQEFIEPCTRKFVAFEDNKTFVEEFGTIIGLFIYNERLAGLYTRVGKSNIISGLTEYYTLPNILVNERK